MKFKIEGEKRVRRRNSQVRRFLKHMQRCYTAGLENRTGTGIWHRSKLGGEAFGEGLAILAIRRDRDKWLAEVRNKCAAGLISKDEMNAAFGTPK